MVSSLLLESNNSSFVFSDEGIASVYKHPLQKIKNKQLIRMPIDKLFLSHK